MFPARRRLERRSPCYCQCRTGVAPVSISGYRAIHLATTIPTGSMIAWMRIIRRTCWKWNSGLELKTLAAIFDSIALAQRLCLSGLSGKGGLAGSASSLDLPRLSASVHSDCGHNLRGDPFAPASLVSGCLAGHQSKVWCQCFGDAAGSRIGQL